MTLSLLRSGSIVPIWVHFPFVRLVAVLKIKSCLTEDGESLHVDKIKIPLESNIGRAEETVGVTVVTMCVLCLAMDRHISQRSDTVDTCTGGHCADVLGLIS